MMDACPPQNDLFALVSDKLDASRREAVEAHLGACERCQRAILAWAGDLPTLVRDTGDVTPRTAFLERLKQTAQRDSAVDLEAAPKRKVPTLTGLEVFEEIGRGGSSVVYRARQIALRRDVALKVIRVTDANSADYERNRRGVEMLAGLTHPGIVSIYQVGRDDDLAYGLLEYMAGGSLKTPVIPLVRSPERAARLMIQVADAVDYMHQRGILHRDLKSSNVLLTAEGQPKVADFGLAKPLSGIGDLTRTGEILGTPAYMAPEQATENKVGVASDVYSLGVILYELLTGKPPFHDRRPLDLLDQVVHLPPPPPSRAVAGVPHDLETICLKCLQKEPEDRYASARELAEDLNRFLANEPIRARTTPPVERFSKWLRRRPGAAAALAASLGLALLGLAILGIERRALNTALHDETRLRLALQTERLEETKRREEIELSLYHARLALARQALAAGNLAVARDALEACVPGPGQTDLRDREWHQLSRQLVK